MYSNSDPRHTLNFTLLFSDCPFDWLNKRSIISLTLIEVYFKNRTTLRNPSVLLDKMGWGGVKEREQGEEDDAEKENRNEGREEAEYKRVNQPMEIHSC